MFLISNIEDEVLIGPFTTANDAVSFISKLETMSNNHLTGFIIKEIENPEEWLEQNMDELLMAFC